MTIKPEGAQIRGTKIVATPGPATDRIILSKGDYRNGQSGTNTVKNLEVV